MGVGGGKALVAGPLKKELLVKMDFFFLHLSLIFLFFPIIKNLDWDPNSWILVGRTVP